MNQPTNNIDLTKWDYWMLRFWRDASVILLFIVAPILQIVFFRWLPFAILLAFIFIMIGHLLTGWRHFFTDQTWHPRLWPKAAQLLAIFYLLFCGWAAVGLFWSPRPVGGIKDIAVLLIAPPTALVLAVEHSKTVIASFPRILVAGMVLTLIILVLELSLITTFYMLSGSYDLYDLNRNAILLGLLFWPMVSAINRSLGSIMASLAVVGLFLTMMMWTLSQSAQLGFVIAVLTWLTITIAPRLYRLVFPGLALVLLLFPLLLNPIDNSFAGKQSWILAQSSASARAQIWLGYRSLVSERPIVGWGIRANRYYGSGGEGNSDPNKNKHQIHFSHPHNFAMEFWTDFGLVGILLFSAALVALGELLMVIRVRLRPIAAAISVAIFSCSMTSAAFTQGWWIASICMSTIAAIAVANWHHDKATPS